MVSPGVPADHPALAGCRARGVPVLGEVELAYRTMTAEFVAITGTNGKTTTTALTGALLAESGRPGPRRREHRPAARRPRRSHFPADGWVVAEVSSFQLETTDAFRPRVAAVLNVTPDHLDRHGSLAAYAEAKARIFRAQGPEDWAVLNADDPGAAALAPRVAGAPALVQPPAAGRRGGVGPRGLGDAPPRRRGAARSARSTRSSSAAPTTSRTCSPRRRAPARSACRPSACGRPSAPSGPCRTGIEWIRERAGVAFYNDSKGTNVDATLKALAAFEEPIVLIAGGRDKGQRFDALADAARGRVKAAVVIGEGRATLGPALRAVTRVEEAASMAEAVRRAAALAAPGDVVLLSPACASFDMFRDYEHRGAVFAEEVRALPEP